MFQSDFPSETLGQSHVEKQLIGSIRRLQKWSVENMDGTKCQIPHQPFWPLKVKLVAVMGATTLSIMCLLATLSTTALSAIVLSWFFIVMLNVVMCWVSRFFIVMLNVVMLSVVSPGRGPNRKYNTKVCPQRQRQRKRSFIQQKHGDNVLKLFTAVS